MSYCLTWYILSHAHEPKKEFLSRTQSLDNLMFVQSTQETKPLKDLDIKHVESKLNRVALKARKYFSTLTDVYQKIEVKINIQLLEATLELPGLSNLVVAVH